MIIPVDNIDSVINADTENEDEMASPSHENINIIPAENLDSVINTDTVFHTSEDKDEEDKVTIGQ
eukprot:6714572-Heterocapsa_arctica.AAC.1